MAQVSAVATVVAADLEKGVTYVDQNTQLPFGPLPLHIFTPLADRVTPSQLLEIQVGVSALRRTFSSFVLTHFVLRRVSLDALSRTHVGSDRAWARIKRGGVLISLMIDPGFHGEGRVGRPVAESIDDAFKEAFGQAVARILRLGMVAERDDYGAFEKRYQALGQRLQVRESLFNLNASHLEHHVFPVLNWCEANGPRLLAAAYGLEEAELERSLDAAFQARLRQRSFESVLDDEFTHIDTLSNWVNAHLERKEGTASRRDTIRRLLDEPLLDPGTVPEGIDPPSIYGKVRQKLVAEKTMPELSTEAMLEAAFLFDLEPAHTVFLTRLYLVPVLAAAALAGRVGLRRRPGVISNLYAAGGCMALAENLPAERDVAPGEREEEDEIEHFQALVRETLTRSGLSVKEIAVNAYNHSETGEPVEVEPPAGPRRFFVDE